LRLTSLAFEALERAFRPGYRYARAGVLLFGLEKTGSSQLDVFEAAEEGRRRRLMSAMDDINLRMGDNAIRLGAAGLDRGAWPSKSEHRSPRYTTRLEELPSAR